MGFLIAVIFVGGYVLAAFAVTRLLASRARTVIAKRVVASMSVLVFVLIPTGDAIVAKIYHGVLCRSDSGTKFYKALPRDHEIYDERGASDLFMENGDIKEDIVKRYVDMKLDVSPVVLRISRTDFIISNKKSGDVYGELVDYMNFGGWVANSTGLPVIADTCYETEDRSALRKSLYQAIFSGKGHQ